MSATETEDLLYLEGVLEAGVEVDDGEVEDIAFGGLDDPLAVIGAIVGDPLGAPLPLLEVVARVGHHTPGGQQLLHLGVTCCGKRRGKIEGLHFRSEEDTNSYTWGPHAAEEEGRAGN